MKTTKTTTTHKIMDLGRSALLLISLLVGLVVTATPALAEDGKTPAPAAAESSENLLSLDDPIQLDGSLFIRGDQPTGLDHSGWISLYGGISNRNHRGYQVKARGRYAGGNVGLDLHLASLGDDSSATFGFILEGSVSDWVEPKHRKQSWAGWNTLASLVATFGVHTPELMFRVSLGAAFNHASGETMDYKLVRQGTVQYRAGLNVQFYGARVEFGRSAYATPFGDVTVSDEFLPMIELNCSFSGDLHAEHNDTELRAGRRSRPANMNNFSGRLGIYFFRTHFTVNSHVIETWGGAAYLHSISHRQEGYLRASMRNRYSSGYGGEAMAKFRLSSRIALQMSYGASYDDIGKGIVHQAGFSLTLSFWGDPVESEGPDPLVPELEVSEWWDYRGVRQG